MRRKLIRRFLNKRGFTIAPIKPADEGPTLQAALRRLKRRNIPFQTIIDVGASNGSWSAIALEVFPEPRYLCIEAQTAHEPALKKFVSKHSRIEYVISAAGAEEGKLYFEASDLFGGVASYRPFARNCIVVPVTTIDLQVRQRGLTPPYLIKLDTHGFEVPILDGAVRTLEQTEALIIEVYNFKSNPPALLFHEMCQHLAAKGFRCIDAFDLLCRPHDQAFWQMDMLFVRADRPEFKYLGYT
jgi:FkbM family methyltransferase